MKEFLKSIHVSKISKLLGFFRRLSREENGQATVEYMLLLAVVVSIAIYALKKIGKPLFLRISRAVDGQIKDFFKPSKLHYFRIGR